MDCSVNPKMIRESVTHILSAGKAMNRDGRDRQDKGEAKVKGKR
jgi:hypothetical protein